MHSCRNPKKMLLDNWALNLVDLGIAIYEEEDWEGSLRRVEDEANRQSKEHDRKGQEQWKRWAADDSFLNGAKQAHRFSKVKALHEVLRPGAGEQPHELADTALQEWEGIWSHHGLSAFQPPEGAAANWERLPPLCPHELRRALTTFGWSTAVGQSGIHPRTSASL